MNPVVIVEEVHHRQYTNRYQMPKTQIIAQNRKNWPKQPKTAKTQKN